MSILTAVLLSNLTITDCNMMRDDALVTLSLKIRFTSYKGNLDEDRQTIKNLYKQCIKRVNHR